MSDTAARRRNAPLKPFLAILVVLTAITAVVVAQSTSYTVFIIGDSTVCDYAESKYPWAGWGQVLSKFFTAGTVTVNNRAIGGRSSKSFYVEGRWATVAGELREGDFVFIQFGHNDRDYTKEERYADTNTYKSYLRLYVSESRAKGAIPVFVTPMNMNTWNGTALREVFTERDRGADYRGAMINVATKLDVPLIDLEKKSAAFMKSVGQAYCTSFHFMGLQTGEYPNYPDGYSDGTHFQEMGAIINARMVAEGIKELSSYADMEKLAEVLAPLHKVTVTPNKSNTGLVTVSGDFPAGVTVTVKVMPNSGETFLNWADGSVSDVSSEKLYTFTMKDAPVTMHARFKGGDPVRIKQGYRPNTNNVSPSLLNMNGENNSLSISSAVPVTNVTVFDLNGRNVVCKRGAGVTGTTVSLQSLGSGTYMLEVVSTQGTFSQRISVP